MRPGLLRWWARSTPAVPLERTTQAALIVFGAALEGDPAA